MRKLKFEKEPTDFYRELRAEVEAYFKNTNTSYRANRQLIVKITTMFVLYILAYFSIYFTSQWWQLVVVYAFMGSWGILLGLNIGHDAAHNAIFRKRKHNELLLFVFELLGTSAYNWKNRHLGAHHVYPNVMDHDSDIQQTKIVKVFPKDEHRSYHKFQFLYMPLLYMIYIFRWIVYRDFKDVVTGYIGYYDNRNYPKSEIFKMIFSKVFFLLYMVGLPALVLDYSIWQVFLAFVVFTVAGSLTITMVLLSTHVGENAVFPAPNQEGKLPYSWSYHQVYTTADFSTNSWLVNQLFGGFNHHVIHHLFPHISHIHYPKLTPILREKAKKYNLPYRHTKYLLAAMFSHFKLLYRNGKN